MAIEGGRLDEAFQLLRSSAETKHANGQRLSDRLITELLNRAQLHLDHDRLQAAQLDAEMAKQLGGQQVAVVQLLEQVDNRQRSQAGHARKAASSDKLRHLETLVKTSDHEQTLKWLATQSVSFRESPETIDLVAKPIAELKTLSAADFNSGRLDRCAAKINLLLEIGNKSQDTIELHEQLIRCRSVDQAIQEAKFEVALRTIQIIQQVSAKAVWVKSALAAIKQCQTGIDTLHAGPLGLLPSRLAEPLQPSLLTAAPQRPLPKKPVPSPMNLVANSNCSQSLLQVDQLGGILLLRGNSISIGTPRIASDSTVVLQTDGLTSKIKISRDGEDYFVSSNDGLFVNDYMAKQHILNHGDIITVGARGRLKFLRPVAASNSAVLIVQGAKLKRRDIHGIVLVDEAVIFGDSHCHFSVPNLPRRVIVRPNDSGQEFLIHEKGASQQHRLAYGQSRSIADVGFTLLPVMPAFQGKTS